MSVGRQTVLPSLKMLRRVPIVIKVDEESIAPPKELNQRGRGECITLRDRLGLSDDLTNGLRRDISSIV